MKGQRRKVAPPRAGDPLDTPPVRPGADRGRSCPVVDLSSARARRAGREAPEATEGPDLIVGLTRLALFRDQHVLPPRHG